ncbi:MAG: cbb3-type cytochrome c oxidase subunit 3 [Proteobacteria bacterium]|nr:cbb3-type cytochrome c oxidase subunit 3 [Pseudomonadota bacterium]
MSGHSTYEGLRHFADSWALGAMVLVFAVLIAWPFRPGARRANDEAANMIFADDDLGGKDHGE